MLRRWWQAFTVLALVTGLASGASTPVPVPTGLNCEQLFTIAQSVVRYRDQGYSLDQVVGALKTADPEGKLTPPELEVLRNTVSLVYLGQVSPEEVTVECLRLREKGKRS